MLESNSELIRAGASLHWLHRFDYVDAKGLKRGKSPIAKDWTKAPTRTLEQLKSSAVDGNNIGLRLGEPSKIGNLYLHVIDMDIPNDALRDKVHAILRSFVPNIDSFPSVISGSGGNSRHFYFLTETPFRKKLLAGGKKDEFEIALMGTGSQVVLPPSIHPDTHQPYRWERPLELDFPALMTIPAATVESWGVSKFQKADDLSDEDFLELAVLTSTLDLTEDEIDAYLDDVPNDNNYHQYVEVGMALHHQYRGSEEGFEKWSEWAQQVENFHEDDARYKWDSSFGGDGNSRVVTFRSIIAAANANRSKDFLLTISDGDDDGFNDPPATGLSDLLSDAPPAAPATLLIDLSTDAPAAAAPIHVPAVSEIPKPDPEWTSLMALNDDGVPIANLHNVSLIVGNDIRLYASKEFNEFTSQVVKRQTPNRISKKRDSAKTPANLDGPHWKVRDPINGDPYSDTLINDIRRCIEAPKTQGGYGIKVSDRDLHAAVDITARKNSFHPVRDMLIRFHSEWDGKRGRVETLFTDYLKCPDTPYHRDAARLFLLGAVARIFQPGCKFDFVPIIEGAQGKGKTTFIQTLSVVKDYYRELVGDISDPKESVAALSGAWILEIGELSAMYRAEVNDLKAFVSRQVDTARMPYERSARSFPRQCVFIGSTNDREYLKDASGGRRYWPIECRIEGSVMIDNNRLRREIGQIWGEAVHLYIELAQGGDLRLFLENEDAAAEALLMQESRRAETSEEVLSGQIEAWLDIPMGDETGFDDLDPNPTKHLRDVTCVAQIWVEMMGRQGAPQNSEAQRIGKALGILGWERSKSQTRSHGLNKKYGKCVIYQRPA